MSARTAAAEPAIPRPRKWAGYPQKPGQSPLAGEAVLEVRPDQLQSGKVVPAVEPAAPREVLGVVAPRHGRKSRVPVCQEVMGRRIRRQFRPSFCQPEGTPEDVLSALWLRAEDDDLRDREGQPEPGRGGKRRPLFVAEYGCARPSVLPDAGDESLLGCIKTVRGASSAVRKRLPRTRNSLEGACFAAIRRTFVAAAPWCP